MSLSFRQAWPQGKNGRGAIEGLNLALLVKAQNQRPIWRIEIEPHHIANLLFEARIVGEFKSLHAMRLDIVPLPYPMHNGSAYAQLPGQSANAPMRTAVAGTAFQGRLDNPAFQFRRQDLGLPLALANAGDRFKAVLGESRPHGQYRGPGDIQLLGDDTIGQSLFCQQSDLGAPPFGVYYHSSTELLSATSHRRKK